MTWAGVSNSSHGDGIGSLGALVRERGGDARVFAVTAAHVLATHPDTAFNDDVDIEGFRAGTPVRARLCDWLPRFDSGGAGDMDAALSTLVSPAWESLAATPDLLPRGVAQPTLDAEVFLRRENGVVRGRLLGYVSCWMRAGQQHQRRYFLSDAICYQLEQPSQHGDSGAPLWDAHERLLAVHVGATPPGTAGNALGVPIQRILDRWAVDLVCRGDPAPMRPLLPAQHRLVATGEAAPSDAEAKVADDRDVLIRTVWGEARGEPPQGMAAVAHVVLNRVRAQRYWGRTISAVCLKPYQFSCWNENDPNRAKLLRLTSADPRWTPVADIVDRMLGNALADPSDGATHYHNRWMPRPPRWVQGRQPCGLIGNHAFYKNID